jgi:hypothetical protein
MYDEWDTEARFQGRITEELGYSNGETRYSQANDDHLDTMVARLHVKVYKPHDTILWKIPAPADTYGSLLLPRDPALLPSISSPSAAN